MESTCCISLMSNSSSGSTSAPSNICYSRISQQQKIHCGDTVAVSNDIHPLTAVGLNTTAGQKEGLWLYAFLEEVYFLGS